MQLRTILSLLLLYLLPVLGSGCTYTSQNGSYHYDLTGLHLIGDLTATSTKGVDFLYQVCSSVRTTAECSGESVCFKEAKAASWTKGGTTESAIWSDRVDQPNRGAVITYSNGDLCGKNNMSRKSIVHLNCLTTLEEKSVKNANMPQHQNKRWLNPYTSFSYITNIDDSQECVTVLQVESHYGCPKNDYPSECLKKKSKGECFAPGCECSWCEGQCIPANFQCKGEAENECLNASNYTRVMIIRAMILFGIVFTLLLACLCGCTYLKRREQLLLQKANFLPLPSPAHPQTQQQPYIAVPQYSPYMYVPMYVGGDLEKQQTVNQPQQFIMSPHMLPFSSPTDT